MNQTIKNVFQFLTGVAVLLLIGCCAPYFIFIGGGILMAPFLDFTFTDAIDFAPLGVILLSVAGLALRHAIRPYPDAWVRFARCAAYVLSVLPPLIYFGALCILASYAQQAVGHYPQPMIDDPKNIAHNDAAYQKMYHVVNYTEAFSGAFVFVWAALLLHLRRRFSRTDWIVLTGLFLLSWLLFVMDRRFAWWLD